MTSGIFKDPANLSLEQIFESHRLLDQWESCLAYIFYLPSLFLKSQIRNTAQA